MAGTRMAPVGSIRHSVAETFSKPARSMATSFQQAVRFNALHVDDALGAPAAVRLLGDLQRRQRRALDLDRGLVTRDIDGLAQCAAVEAGAGDRHLEGAE